MYEQLVLPDLREMLDTNDELGMAEFCRALYPGVVAEVLVGLEASDAWKVLSKCEVERQAEIFEFLPIPVQVDLVEGIDRKSLLALIEEMAPDDRVDLLGRLEPQKVEALLPLIAQAERTDIRKLLSYEEYTAGSIMTTEYASLPEDITVGDALARLRKQAPDRETIYYIYVTSEQRHLIGFVSLRTLILAKPEQKIADVMRRDVIFVHVNDDQEFVAHELNRYDFIAIPVVDENNRLVGIVTHDDASDVLREEAEEDQHRLAAIEPLEDTYLTTPVLTLARKRVVWLFVLLVAALVTARVLQFFEGGSETGWIMMFLPLVLASGGNAGSQSAALVIGALAREKSSIDRSTITKIMTREIILGSLLGIFVSVISFVFAAWLLNAVLPPLVVGITVFLVILMATTAGAALPILFHYLQTDPALMSTPLIAALVDVVGVIIYFVIAGAIVAKTATVT